MGHQPGQDVHSGNPKRKQGLCSAQAGLRRNHNQAGRRNSQIRNPRPRRKTRRQNQIQQKKHIKKKIQSLNL